jgi:exopolysaccharide biosynthesis predicted pyruvyltransferase EpsI
MTRHNPQWPETSDPARKADIAEASLRRQSRLPPSGVDALLLWTRLGNAGDRLIADACERFLRDRGISVWRSDGSIEDASLAGDREYLGDLFAGFRGMVMFAGGGNIGIYPDNGAIRAGVIAHLGLKHHCLVFPQSALAPEPALIGPTITVWCRDAESKDVLDRVGTRTVLVPDIALYMDDLIEKSPGGEGLFYIKRRPRDTETIDHGIDPGCPSEDLPRLRDLDGMLAVLKPYEVVISDRLHGGLIAAMMGKKVLFLPVGYHKIQSFYDTWLGSRPGMAYVGAQHELAAKLANLRPPEGDLRALFCERAQPAFNRFLLGG